MMSVGEKTKTKLRCIKRRTGGTLLARFNKNEEKIHTKQDRLEH
jgi:hypothetical protein